MKINIELSVDEQALMVSYMSREGTLHKGYIRNAKNILINHLLKHNIDYNPKMKITWYRIVDWPPPGCPKRDYFWVKDSYNKIESACSYSIRDLGWKYWTPKPEEENLEPIVPQPPQD